MFRYTPSEIRMPATQQLPDGNTWVVEQPFRYDGAGKTFIVPPSGLYGGGAMVQNPVWTTDYGSIPQVFQNIFQRDGRYAPAFLLHDWLYAAEIVTRRQADAILLDALQELGANWFTRNTIWTAVRAGGGFVWRKHDPVEVARLRRYAEEVQALIPVRWPELV